MKLTAREKEIIELIALDHLSAKQIAFLLFKSQETVNDHIKRIKTKLNIHTQSEIVAYYYSERFHFAVLNPLWRRASATLLVMIVMLVEVVCSDRCIIRTRSSKRKDESELVIYSL